MTEPNYNEAMNQLLGHVNNAVAFSQEQLPQVAQEMLIYYSSLHTFWLVAFLIVLGIGAILFVWGLVADEDGVILWGVTLSIFGFMASGVNYMELNKIEKAPKLYVLDEIRARIPSACNK